MTTTDTGHQASTPTCEGLLISARDLLREIETVLIHAGPATNHEVTTILSEQAGNHGGHGNLIDQVQLRVLAIDDHLTNH